MQININSTSKYVQKVHEFFEARTFPASAIVKIVNYVNAIERSGMKTGQLVF